VALDRDRHSARQDEQDSREQPAAGKYRQEAEHSRREVTQSRTIDCRGRDEIGQQNRSQHKEQAVDRRGHRGNSKREPRLSGMLDQPPVDGRPSARSSVLQSVQSGIVSRGPPTRRRKTQ
jgi:hypothetical protein